MRLQQSSILAALVATTLASPIELAPSAELATRSQTCTDQAVIFIVRGSDPGHTDLSPNPNPLPANDPMRDIGQAIINKAGGNSYYSAIQYPAVTNKALYAQSVNMGILALQGAIYDYMKACPNRGRIYVIGYSQGAQVTSGALGGSGVAGPVDDRGHIHGAVAFADPTFIDYLNPIDRGTGEHNGRNGILAGDGSKQRYMNANFAPRYRTYCQLDDSVCDSGNSVNNHINSVNHFKSVATSFMLSRV